jgi:acyl-CoA synthetase (AMP-forming)/AMP-acid ligase II
LGVTQILLLPAYREKELKHIIAEAKPSALIVSSNSDSYDFFGLAKRVQEGFPELKVLALEDVPSETDRALPGFVAPNPGEPRFLIYTSGTTGSPKGVQHSDQSVIAGARAMHLSLETSPSDRQTLNYPFAHIGGIMNLVTMVATGSASVLVERFEPDRHVPLFRELKVTLPGAGPPFFRMYLGVQRKQPGESILPDARIFPGGGAPKTPTLHYEVRDEIGGEGIFTGYGMSEAPLIAGMLLDSPDEKKALTDGVPALGASIRLVDGDGNEVPVGEEGEIRVKGPQVFIGYVDQRLNEEAFDADGYFRTGDLGRFDEDGYLRLTGRLKDVIIRKGENISAKEIEDLLDVHAKVGQVAVVGVPDEERGEMACAVVVPVDPDDPLTFDEMVSYLEGAGLARHKLPERLEIHAELPKNVMGKIQKNKLRLLLTSQPQ